MSSRETELMVRHKEFLEENLFNGDKLKHDRFSIYYLGGSNKIIVKATEPKDGQEKGYFFGVTESHLDEVSEVVIYCVNDNIAFRFPTEFIRSCEFSMDSEGRQRLVSSIIPKEVAVKYYNEVNKSEKLTTSYNWILTQKGKPDLDIEEYMTRLMSDEDLMKTVQYLKELLNQ